MNKNNKTIICPFCGSEIKANAWKTHLINFHSNESSVDLITIWNQYAGIKVSVKNKCANDFIKYLIRNKIIFDIIKEKLLIKI